MALPPRPRLETTPAGQLSEAGLRAILGYQLAQATVTMTAVFDREVRAALGLSRVEFTMLMLIRDNPGCSGTRMAKALAVTPSNVTMCMDRLEARGLIERHASTTDRRRTPLRLSAEGERLIDEASQRVQAGERDALAELTDAERALLLELLHRVGLCRPG